MTGIKPEPWTAETVVLRTPGFGDATNELRLAMNVAKLGVKEANRLAAPDPWDDLTVPEGLDVKLITDEIVAATRTPTGQLPRPEIVDEYRTLLRPPTTALWLPVDDIRERGSNNWVMKAQRQPLIEAGLQKAIQKLGSEQGSDWRQWRWGRMHTRDFPHPVLKEFDLPTVERGGGAGAVEADGASYREILDVSNWDNSLTINTPGQSGQPESPFYGNLLPLWANNEYFPMTFSRKAVDEKAAHRLKLTP